MVNKCPYNISCELKKTDDCYRKSHRLQECYQQKAKNIISLSDKREEKRKKRRRKTIDKIIANAPDF